MPIYEYQCEACGNKLEKLQKLSDDPLKDCPDCEKPELKKLVSAAVFRLKGAGWYETDFKTGDKKNVSDGDSKEADSGSSDADSGSSDADSSSSKDSGSSDGDSGSSIDSGSSKSADSGSSDADSGSSKTSDSAKGSTAKSTDSSTASN